jgi:hypothetical protein
LALWYAAKLRKQAGALLSRYRGAGASLECSPAATHGGQALSAARSNDPPTGLLLNLRQGNTLKQREWAALRRKLPEFLGEEGIAFFSIEPRPYPGWRWVKGKTALAAIQASA